MVLSITENQTCLLTGARLNHALPLAVSDCFSSKIAAGTNKSMNRLETRCTEQCKITISVLKESGPAGEKYTGRPVEGIPHTLYGRERRHGGP